MGYIQHAACPLCSAKRTTSSAPRSPQNERLTCDLRVWVPARMAPSLAAPRANSKRAPPKHEFAKPLNQNTWQR
eukprot:12924418-Prorocentrum_lima.AAC.1